MVKLNQIIAIANGKKTALEKGLTELYQKLGKAELFHGISRNYKPDDDNGETQPAEVKLLQMKTSDAVKEAKMLLTEMFDITLTQDKANTQAKSDVVVNGIVLVKDVPVTNLLFLEKKITDLKTFVNKLPTLDTSEQWVYDENSDAYKTNPTTTNKTKKLYKTLVKAPATENHPAQVDIYTEDVKVGIWDTVKFSGAIPVKDKNELVARIVQLDDAIKFARENANNMEVEKQNSGQAILEFVFGK